MKEIDSLRQEFEAEAEGEYRIYVQCLTCKQYSCQVFDS